MSDPTNDCPRQIPVDSTTTPAKHLNITVLLENLKLGEKYFSNKCG
jgi:hypothetical protein